MTRRSLSIVQLFAFLALTACVGTAVDRAPSDGGTGLGVGRNGGPIVGVPLQGAPIGDDVIIDGDTIGNRQEAALVLPIWSISLIASILL